MKSKALVLIAIIIGLVFTGISVSSAEEKKVGNSIFEFKKELSLTDKQEKNLHDIIAKLQSNLTEKQKELKGLRAEINKMIAERASLDKIKTKLQSIAKTQADVTYEDIASTRAIETELTVAQLTKWRGMQAEFAKNLKQAQDAQVAAANQKGSAK
ncbi:MAG: hypothetical protein NTZ95_01805 [Candidatus Omnitrophica bacterium]|nr:hypothetical protein [Candidatus Omnitrophota bacterium]